MNSQTILMSQTLQRCRCLDLGFTVAVVEALAFGGQDMFPGLTRQTDCLALLKVSGSGLLFPRLVDWCRISTLGAQETHSIDSIARCLGVSAFLPTQAKHNLDQQSVRKTLDFLVNVTCGCVDTLFCCRQQLKSFTWSSRLCQVDTQRFALTWSNCLFSSDCTSNHNSAVLAHLLAQAFGSFELLPSSPGTNVGGFLV